MWFLVQWAGDIVSHYFFANIKYSHSRVSPALPLSSSRWLARDSNICDVAGRFQIRPVPFGYNNIGYIIADFQLFTIILVDVGDAETFSSTITTYYPNYKISAILCTTDEWVCTAGNKHIIENEFDDELNIDPEIKVVGPRNLFMRRLWSDFVKRWLVKINFGVGNGDHCKIGDLNFTFVETYDSSMIYILSFPPSHESNPQIFTGLSISKLGGPYAPERNYGPRISKFQKLTKKTFPELLKNRVVTMDSLIWPGLEVAFENTEFLKHLENDDFFVEMQLTQVKDHKFTNTISVPFTVESEITFNPFWRIFGKYHNMNAVSRRSRQTPSPGFGSGGGLIGGGGKSGGDKNLLLWKSVVEKSSGGIRETVENDIQKDKSYMELTKLGDIGVMLKEELVVLTCLTKLRGAFLSKQSNKILSEAL
ncbi:hypothetical protein HK098_004441 [Nowakowskiella sp. JEL0407]|nr:hypothetical protein HK098_004441 [Nowakowskiella sp. JEL0407]